MEFLLTWTESCSLVVTGENEETIIDLFNEGEIDLTEYEAYELSKPKVVRYGSLKLTAALKIVLDLAEQNALEVGKVDDELKTEAEKQERAINTVFNFIKE